MNTRFEKRGGFQVLHADAHEVRLGSETTARLGKVIHFSKDLNIFAGFEAEIKLAAVGACMYKM